MDYYWGKFAQANIRQGLMRRREYALQAKDPIKYIPQEALSFLLDNRFTKQQYIAIRLSSKNRNCDIYPSYQQVLEAKSEYQPDNIEISENLAKVPFQDLLPYTTNKIFILQEDVISRITIGKHQVSATPVASYDFDGSSGHSEYEQKFLNKAEGFSRFQCFCNYAYTTKTDYEVIDTSDPLISSLSLQSRRLKLKIKKLPEEVLKLLESHAQPENLNITTDDSQSDALDLESFLGSELDSLELDSELQNI
ncbi:unnamed protein product [Psylliodes chrysocephalus]|uniref:Uncharacterized protein n=1 Tax=Psylliodes chrysocephalus TaxID=3402493 RepID=A0A9P0GJE2_9CUCU|nr:unnamed protein product [Psylliodes chrysocephala]